MIINEERIKQALDNDKELYEYAKKLLEMEKKEKEEETKMEEVKKERNEGLKLFCVLWKATKKDGSSEYLNGKTEDGKKVVAFYNTNKKEPNESDIRVYIVGKDGSLGDCDCYLWDTTSKNGNSYLRGKNRQSQRYVGYYNHNTEKDKRPYIRVYLNTEVNK